MKARYRHHAVKTAKAGPCPRVGARRVRVLPPFGVPGAGALVVVVLAGLVLIGAGVGEGAGGDDGSSRPANGAVGKGAKGRGAHAEPSSAVEMPQAEIPGAEISLPEDQVTDRFYGYLIGLVDANTCGVVDGSQLHKVLKDHLGRTSIPFETIKEIRRDCAAGSSVRDISITFTRDLEADVPYSILGYHPGSVAASEKVKFLEWYMPSQKISASDREILELSQVFVFGIYEGWALVDIDTWVDKILGGFLDDTRIVTMVLFKYKGEWHGLAAGYGRSGEGRSGIFNFHTNRILFPTPKELQVLAPYFRNFVVRTKRLESPVPPGDRWKAATR
jgi:hypothetical protein